jgi:hypothetical protein
MTQTVSINGRRPDAGPPSRPAYAPDEGLT